MIVTRFVYDFGFCASMWDNFFSSHIEEKTNMHGLWLRNIITFFVKTLYFFSSYFAVSWVMVYKFWSKQSTIFKFFKNKVFFKNYTFWSFSWYVVHAFWSKIIKFGKILYLGGEPNRPFLVIFICYTVHAFWPKIIKFVMIPKLLLVQKLHL